MNTVYSFRRLYARESQISDSLMKKRYTRIFSHTLAKREFENFSLGKRLISIKNRAIIVIWAILKTPFAKI